MASNAFSPSFPEPLSCLLEACGPAPANKHLPRRSDSNNDTDVTMAILGRERNIAYGRQADQAQVKDNYYTASRHDYS